MFKITSREIKRWKIQFFKYKRGIQNSVCFSKWCAFVYNCRFMLLNTCVHLNAISLRGLKGPIWKHLIWKARKLCRLCCWLLFDIVLSHQIRDSGKFSSKTPFCWNLSIYWGKTKQNKKQTNKNKETTKTEILLPAGYKNFERGLQVNEVMMMTYHIFCENIEVYHFIYTFQSAMLTSAFMPAYHFLFLKPSTITLVTPHGHHERKRRCLTPSNQWLMYVAEKWNIQIHHARWWISSRILLLGWLWVGC